MTRRQIDPHQWLILASAPQKQSWMAIRRLPLLSGVIVLPELGANERRQLRQLAKLHKLSIAVEGRQGAARVHNLRELRRALLRRTPLILLSPIYETRSHPDWKPLPRMRASALARLAGRKAIALGGMSAERYAIIAPLGFIGWAGISAWKAGPSRK
jgi:thiamine-phosphate pyrophosphorylase